MKVAKADCRQKANEYNKLYKFRDVTEQNGWAQVSLPDGRSGWTLRRYLSRQPPWRVTAERLQRKKDALQQQVRKINKSNQRLPEENRSLEKELDMQQQELESVKREYEALVKESANYAGLKEAYEKLKTEVPQIEAKLREAQRARDELSSSDSIRWFLSGAGVLLVGWLIGLFLGSRKRRTKHIYR